MAVMSLLLLLVAPSAVVATRCSGLYGAEALTCAWEQDVKTCMETSCHGCSGEPCQLCREDTEKIHDCCQKHYHSASPPLMCESAAITEGVKACVQAECQGCSGEQCQLCQEDSARISACCTQHDVSDPPQICRDAMKGPCDGLQGDALGSCQWEQEVTACLDNKCAGCSGEQCQLCRESSESILSCCNEGEQEASQPEMCKTAFETTMTKCVEDQCRKCSGEQCQLCREDAERYTACCKQHGVSTKVCEAAQTQGREHRREILL